MYKSLFRPQRRSLSALALLLLTLTTLACGNKGPLYLPDAEPNGERRSEPS
jgi:predicted small lipoprotein YifL